jgi:hypothetical protein
VNDRVTATLPASACLSTLLKASTAIPKSSSATAMASAPRPRPGDRYAVRPGFPPWPI